jgi:serine/threonine protein kinase/HEAT repeat protein
MNPSNRDSYLSSLGFGDISFDRVPKEMPFPPSRMKLPEEDPFSLKVIEKLEREGLFIRWRFGYRLANRYEVRRIHSGGVGIVWIVEDLFDNRKPYAAKSVKPFFRKPATDEEWKRREKSIQRFLEECKIWVDLEKHRHIVYAEFLEKIEGVPLVMSEYIEGGDLTEWIRKGPMPIEKVLEFAIQFCIGMEYANEKGVLVHRDIKPGNIMVTKEGTLKINDFGLTKAIESAEGIREIEEDYYKTLDVNISLAISRGRGTPKYMALEQFDEILLRHFDLPLHPVTNQSDIYPFGLTLFEMITGKHPFDIQNSENDNLRREAYQLVSRLRLRPDYNSYVFFFLKTLNLNPSPPISGNVDLDHLILKCLKKNPAERYQSFSEIKEELVEIYHQVTGRQFVTIQEPTPKPNFKNKGKTAFILGREEEAIKFYDKALEENPGDTDVWLEKGLAMAEMGKLGEFGVCVEVTYYLKPSKGSSLVLNKNRVLDDEVFSTRDIRLFQDIAKTFSIIEKLLNHIPKDIQNLRGEVFKDFDSELIWLLTDLKSNDYKRSIYAASALIKLKNPFVKPIFIEALQDKNVDIREAAVSALRQLNDPSLIPIFVESLRDEDARIREEAIWALVELRDPSNIPILIEALKDKTSIVRKMAKVGLRKLKNSSIISFLIEKLRDRNSGIRKEAAQVFIYILVGALRDIYAKVREVPEELVGKPVEAFLGLFDIPFNIRERISEIRIANALRKMKGSSVIPILVQFLKDKNYHTRKAAIKALLAFMPYTKRFRFLSDETWYYDWMSIARRILTIQPGATPIPVMLRAIGDYGPDDEVEVVKELKDPSVMSILANTMNDDDDISVPAIWALGALKNPSALPSLVEALRDKRSKYRDHVALVLGSFRDTSILPFLGEALKNENERVRRAVILALELFEDPCVLPILIDAIEDEDNDIVARSIKALRYIWFRSEKEKAKKVKEVLKPYSALEFNNRGLENLKSVNKDEAIKCFEKAIEIDPDWKEPKENLKKCQMGSL